MRTIGLFLAVLFIPVLAGAEIGEVEGGTPAPSGCVTGIAFDGEYVWAADRKSDRIYRIDHQSGTVAGSFEGPGYFMTGLAFDGEYLWVSDIDFTDTSTESYTGKIYRVDPASGMTVGVINPPSPDPAGLAFDGEYLWVSDSGEKNITCISPEDGTTIISFRSPARDPRGLAWDGKYLWVADRSEDELYRVDPESGRVIMILHSPGPYPWGLAWGRERLLSADYQEDIISTIAVFGDRKYTRSKQRHAMVEFTHDIINFGPGTVKDLMVYLAVPTDRASQEIIDISYGAEPDDIKKDRYGQRAALFHGKELPAQGRFASIMKVEAKIYDVAYHLFPEKVGGLDDIPSGIRSRFLQDDDKYRLEDVAIQEAVSEAVGGEKNPYWIARNIFDYLRDRLFYK
ncbi:MAG: transglutaminase, partial [Candidatus Latescibacteria bacterium]|nr:transglutaminase [bacterium]MBD3423117.1 transglutaminase [Candidatus Latescibacterota bacterium]